MLAFESAPGRSTQKEQAVTDPSAEDGASSLKSGNAEGAALPAACTFSSSVYPSVQGRQALALAVVGAF